MTCKIIRPVNNDLFIYGLKNKHENEAFEQFTTLTVFTRSNKCMTRQIIVIFCNCVVYCTTRYNEPLKWKGLEAFYCSLIYLAARLYNLLVHSAAATHVPGATVSIALRLHITEPWLNLNRFQTVQKWLRLLGYIDNKDWQDFGGIAVGAISHLSENVLREFFYHHYSLLSPVLQ